MSESIHPNQSALLLEKGVNQGGGRSLTAGGRWGRCPLRKLSIDEKLKKKIKERTGEKKKKEKGEVKNR